MDLLKFPALVFDTPDELSDARGFSNIFNKLNVKTLILNQEAGVNAFAFAMRLVDRGYSGSFGLCAHCRDRNPLALDSDVLTASALGFGVLYFREPDYRACPAVNLESSLDVIARVRKSFGKKFAIIAQNSFLHKNDLALLEKQLRAGADAAAFNLLSPGPLFVEYKKAAVAFAKLAEIGAKDAKAVKEAKGVIVDAAGSRIDVEIAQELF